jgi:hypothetical protein
MDVDHEQLLKTFEEARAKLNRLAAGVQATPQTEYCKAYQKLVKAGIRLKLKKRLSGGF